MADEAELGLHSRPFAIEHGVGIAGGGVGLVAPLLTSKVDLFVAPTASRWFAILVLRPEAFHAGPGFHQCTIDREVIV